MPSGLDFEAAGDSVIRYFVSNYLLQELRVACCKHNVGALSWSNVETVERAPTRLFGRPVRWSAHVRSFRRLRYDCVF